MGVFALIVLGFIVLVVLIGLSSAIRIINEYERGVLFRLGRLMALKGPGLRLIIPFGIDRLVKIDLRTVTLEVPPQEVITLDNVTIKVNAVIYFLVVDPRNAVTKVANFINATSQIAQTTLRSVLGQSSLDELLANREKINTRLQKIIDEQTEPWGIKVSTVEIKDVELPQTMQRAMAKQAEAEREKRAKIIHAEGEFEAAQELTEVAGGHLVLYRTGAESLDRFRAAEFLAVPLTIAGVLGLLYLWPPVQRALARVIPIRPGSPVIYLTIVLGLLLIAQQAGAQVQPGTPLTLADLLAQDIPLLLLSFVGVGIFVRRSPREASERLGLLPPRQRRWWLVAVVGIFAFLAIAYGIERVADTLSPSSQQQVTNATNVLFSHFNNPLGVILLGLMPAVVEETLFRGALVPRLGVLVTAVLFAALHTQYAVTFATLEVFVLGIGLGLLRVRSGSTLPCMVTHAGYNIAVGLLGFLAK